MGILTKVAGKAIGKAITEKAIGDVAGKAISAVVAGAIIGKTAGKAIERSSEERDFRNDAVVYANHKKTTRNDVKLAKLQIEKAKIDEEARQQALAREMIERKAAMRAKAATQIAGILSYTKNNKDYIFTTIRSLRNECISLKNRIDQAQISAASGTSFREKRLLKKNIKEAASDAFYKFGYLYLSLDYLSVLSMLANGLVLTDPQSALIVKFAPYFSGVKVLEMEEMETAQSETEDNQPALSADCNLADYLNQYHGEQLEVYTLPDIENVFQLFVNAANNKARNNPLNESVKPRCEYCGCIIENNQGICTHCGAPI